MNNITKIKQILENFVNQRGSDLHIRSNAVPYIRIGGNLLPLNNEILSFDEVKEFAFSLMSEEQKKIFEAKKECDLGYDFNEEARLRFNIFQQKGVINIAIRFIPKIIPEKEKLGLPEVIYKLAENRRGLLLVTGPAGSGKSTTLASIVDHINSTRNAHIITIEDPIEFVHKEKKSIIAQRELGIDTITFPDALRHIVRQNPDVILIGEIRDLETMQSALTAAQLGHFVLSTLHTIDAVQTIHRVIDLFPPYQQEQVRIQLADTLRGVISQRLVPLKEGNGLIPATEILVVTPAVKKCIEERNFSDIINNMKQGQYYGMQTFNQSLLNLYQTGKISLNDALQFASSPEDLMLAIKGIEGTSASSSSQLFERFGKK